MWESFFAAAPTVRICCSKAQQCEIKKLNINRYTLEEGAAVQAVASLAGGWLELYFLDLPSCARPRCTSPAVTLSMRLWRQHLESFQFRLWRWEALYVLQHTGEVINQERSKVWSGLYIVTLHWALHHLRCCLGLFVEKDVCYLYGKKTIVTKRVKVFEIKRTGYKKLLFLWSIYIKTEVGPSPWGQTVWPCF